MMLKLEAHLLSSSSTTTRCCNSTVPNSSAIISLTPHHPNTISHWSTALLSLGIAVSISATTPPPSLAIPSLKSQSPSSSPLLPTTPFSQSKNLLTGLDNGKIRPCPSINPGCITTNPQSTSFTFPWKIPQTSLPNALEQLQEAILKTQKNAKIRTVEDTPNGKFIQAEVDGGFGRDVLEFLVKDDVVAYRAMATKVNYVYPFTTAFGDAKGQEERMNKIKDQLGWFAPTIDAMD